VTDTVLIIVIPCCNEEEVLPETAKRLSGKITQLVSEELISPKSSLLFVDDGSSDNTWALIENYLGSSPHIFKGIKLPENQGHQKALLCGLLSAKDYADAVISIDADLQDDIEIIDKMLECFLEGSEIVLGVRSGRECDSFFKKISARFFYSFMRLLGAQLVDNHADFRLMSKNALDALAEYDGESIFLRGIIPMLGLKTKTVYYERKKRFAGKSKYNLRKTLQLAIAGFRLFYSTRNNY
jgi:glycosyltransferase involved in cell wall biosynthesis